MSTEKQFEYMRAWMRLQAGTYDRSWTDQEVAESFLFLAPPTLGIADWVSIMEGEPPKPVTESDPLQRPHPDDHPMGEDVYLKRNATVTDRIDNDPMLKAMGVLG